MRKIGTAAIVLLIAPAIPAAAQAAKDPLARMTTECAVIARDVDRLACYDAAIAEVSPEARAASERRAKETARIAAEAAVVAAAAA
ncbi:MAG: hypothetical protein H7268_12660, partial [Sandarakinorhabdus sp.]|nr:hypothetical protein [Sandarakinorhabdus sp.]